MCLEVHSTFRLKCSDQELRSRSRYIERKRDGLCFTLWLSSVVVSKFHKLLYVFGCFLICVINLKIHRRKNLQCQVWFESGGASRFVLRQFKGLYFKTVAKILTRKRVDLAKMAKVWKAMTLWLRLIWINPDM